MNLLAHCPVWNHNQLMVAAFVPPGMFVLTLALILPFDHSRDAIRFFVMFVGVSCLLAWILVWLIVAVCALEGQL